MSDALEKRIKKHIIGKPHRFLAVVPLGFEQTLNQELCFILRENVIEPPHITGDGKVEFIAKITEAWKAVAYSRIVNRILMEVISFKAENFRDFEKKSSEIPWELYILSEAHRAKSKNPVNSCSSSLNIHVTCKHSRLYHSDAIAERLERIICKTFSSPDSSPHSGIMPTKATSCQVVKETPAFHAFAQEDTQCHSEAEGDRVHKVFPQNIYVNFLDDRCTIWLDLAGEELYKRGHERFVNDAPLKETIAAAMLFEATKATPLPQITIFDFMAGSGTFSLEAACIANKIIPGTCRDFALKHQPAFKEATWNYILRQENSRIESIKNIITSDISERAIEIIKHNEECSPLAEITPNGNTPTINPQLRDFFSYTAKEIAEASPGDTTPIIVLNPPYGKRLDFDAPKLYTKIGRKLAELAHDLKPLGKALTVAILAPKDDPRPGTPYTCTANLLRECSALSPENNSAAKLIVTSHGGLTLNTFIAKI